MIVYVRGSGTKVTLSDKDQLGQPGGQGVVYRRGDTAYKVYHDSSGMVPLSKVAELSSITSPNVIRPLEVLVDAKGKEVGYTMRAVENCRLLLELTTKDGRNRAGLDADSTLVLVKRMRETVSEVHSGKVVLADPNEMNFLVSERLDEVFFIDVDSYQTPRFPATHVMESIRDYHSPGFCEGADWYGMAVLWFQLWVGIHPFRCIHPDHKMPITPERFTERLKAKACAFSPGAKLLPVCQPLDVIPTAYREWMRQMFLGGPRVAPPSAAGAAPTAAAITVRRAGVGERFSITEVATVGEPVLSFFAHGGVRAVVTAKAVHLLGGRKFPVRGPVRLAVTGVGHHLIAAWLDDGMIHFHDVTDDRRLSESVACEQLMSYGGRLYGKNRSGIFEVDFVEYNGRFTGIYPMPVTMCMAHATRLFDGVAVQHVGSRTEFLVFPESGQARVVVVPEVKGRVLNAKYDSGVLGVVTDDAGTRMRYLVRLSTDHATYDVREERDAQTADLNFVVLDTGVLVRITDNDEVELSRRQRGSPDVKLVRDRDIDGDARLFRDGATAVIAKGDGVHAMRSKN